MTALTMLISLSTIIAVTMFCFNRMELGLLPSLIVANVSAILLGSGIEMGAFATANSMNILILGILIAPVCALVFGTETPAESDPALLALNSMANSAEVVTFGIAISVPAEFQAPVRAA